MEERPLEEGELIERARGGDQAAYSTLVKMHQEAAFRTAYVVTGGADDAEDAAQEAFLKAYRSLGRFRAEAPFRPWLLAIVVNEARNRLRSASRRGGLAQRVALGGGRQDVDPSPEESAIASEDRSRVLECLGKLSPDDRLVISLRYLLDMPEKEMAEVLRCRPGTVKSRLSRALGRLKAQMEAEVIDV